MDNAEKERIRIRTEERTRITAKIVSQIGDLLLEDLENSKQSGGSKSNTFAKKKETKKPQNFHHKNNHQKGGNNGPRPNQNANQHINIFCSSSQNQNFHSKSPSCPKPSNGVKFKPQGKTEAWKGRNSQPMNNQRGNQAHASTSSSQNVRITSGNSSQHINVYCGSQQRQSFNNANSPHPKQSFGAKSKPPGMKTGSVYHHNFQPKNNQTGNRIHSNTANYSRKPVAQVNKGPMPSQNANQHINIHCTSRQQQSFPNANSSGSKPSGMVKSKPQGKKPGAIMNQNSKFQHH